MRPTIHNICDGPAGKRRLNATNQEQEHCTTNESISSHSEVLQIAEFLDVQESVSDGASFPALSQSAAASHTNGHQSEQLPAQIDSNSEEQVCFGMVTDIAVNLQSQMSVSSQKFGVTFDCDDRSEYAKVNYHSDGSTLGTVSKSDSIVVSSIAADPDVVIESVAVQDTQSGKVWLHVIIYGPLSAFYQIGEYLEEAGHFLENPSDCGRNVKYRNPHRLAGLDLDAPMTFELQAITASSFMTQESIIKPVNLLNDFESKQAVIEAKKPRALKTDLHPHQKRALQYMIEREHGWNLETGLDLWSIIDSESGVASYRNNISGGDQFDPPPQFRGGILSDEMGLGKTLSMIALVASDKEKEINSQESDQTTGMSVDENLPGGSQGRRTTLLIVPSTLLQTWETQLRQHVHPNELNWIRHYGNNRVHEAPEDVCKNYDLVLTTVMTVLAEHRKSPIRPGILFSTKWHRVVVDEAHCIRNSRALSSKAVGEIDAICRWAVTATPVQNRLSDFASLLRYLRAHPYNNKEAFEMDIINCWNTHDNEEAIARLKRLAQALMLRRSKAMIELPPREDRLIKLPFSTIEADQYQKLETMVAQSLDQDLDAAHLPARSYPSALTSINLLRRFCDIGSVAYSDLTFSITALRAHTNDRWTSQDAQEAFENLSAFGPILCSRCGLEDAAELEAPGALRGNAAKLTQCLKLLCSHCSSISLDQPICEHQPACPTTSLSPMSSSRQELDSEIEPSLQEIPTKVQAVISELRNIKDEKSVVFSFWRSTLDLVQSSLEKEGVGFVRVDGTVAGQQRTKLFESFRNDDHIRVLLLTMSCGAEGLNLVAASRVFLMEPQWNPTLEEQALARAHRIGQQRKVTTVRFVMQGSLEEQIVELQNRKKFLVELMLGETQSSTEKSSHARLQQLRSLLR